MHFIAIQKKERRNKIMINVTRSSMPYFDEYCEEIKEIWDSRWLTNMGPKHQKLQADLVEYLNVDRIDLFCNGHMALEMAIQAMGLSGEVITTPFTFASTTHAIVRNGLMPVFCDVEPGTYTMDVSKIEALITDKTSAIIPVHVYGNICNVEEIEKIAKKHKLKVIYDAAHAFGVKYKGRGIGSFGDASMFSFHATKVFHSIEGGAICFSDEAFGEKLYKLKNFGIASQESVEFVGGNAKMNEFAAAMGICNLRHIDEEIAKRKKAVERYRERLGNIDGITLCPIQENVQQNYAYFPVVFDKDIFGLSRDEVMENLAKEGIGARKYFYPLTNTFDCYDYDANQTPIALEISKKVLTLPLYADLTVDDVDIICNVIINK